MPTASQKLPPLPGPDEPIGWVDMNQKDAQGRPAIIINPNWFGWFKANEAIVTILRTEVP